ncbi:MAG TPA: polysaccharide biosynthesis/export family protein [Opitutaceae bacterium]|jgi:polysaccharide export outer membrane protein
MRFTICLALLLAFSSVRTSAADKASAFPAGSSHALQPDYVLQPYDLIGVVVFQEPDLARDVRISAESTINLPLIGTVDLTGKTVRSAQDLIRHLYDKDYLVNPQVNVTVKEYAKQEVNVLGSVNTPGTVAIPPDQRLNLLDAITRAGGFTRLADRKKVKLTRLNSDGKTSTTIINADDIIQSNTADSWVLSKGDVIYVPERIL